MTSNISPTVSSTKDISLEPDDGGNKSPKQQQQKNSIFGPLKISPVNSSDDDDEDSADDDHSKKYDFTPQVDKFTDFDSGTDSEIIAVIGEQRLCHRQNVSHISDIFGGEHQQDEEDSEFSNSDDEYYQIELETNSTMFRPPTPWHTADVVRIEEFEIESIRIG